MSQTAFDEDELFGEAASELKTDVQDALDQAWEALPRAETIETTDGATVSEVLGNLDSKIDPDGVETALQEAKKQYTIGSRADAFDDEFSTDVEAEIEELHTALDAIDTITTTSAELTDALSTLEDAETAGRNTEAETGSSTNDETHADQEHEDGGSAPTSASQDAGEEDDDAEREEESPGQASLVDQQEE